MRHYVWDVLLASAAATSSLVSVGFTKHAYAMGIANQGLSIMMAWWAVCRTAALIGFVVVTIVMVIRWFALWALRNFARMETLARLGVVAAGVIVGSVQFAYQRHPRDLWMEGFCNWTRENVDVDGLRTWRNEIGLGHAGITTVDRSRWPRSVAAISPNDVFLDDSELRLSWGGGFGHWGVAVGSLAKSRRWGFPEDRIPIADDFYVWCE